MVLEEPDKRFQRELLDSLRIGRPQGGAERHDEQFNETGGESLP